MERLLDDPMGTARTHLTQLTAELQRVEPLERMAALLAALQEDREMHYRDEEADGGLFDDLRTRRPEWDRKVSLLEAQHPEMLAGLAGLRERLDALGEEIRQVQHDASSLLQVMEAHERAEAELIVDAHYVDVGTGD